MGRNVLDWILLSENMGGLSTGKKMLCWNLKINHGSSGVRTHWPPMGRGWTSPFSRQRREQHQNLRLSVSFQDYRTFFSPRYTWSNIQFKPTSESDHLPTIPALTEQDKSFDSKLHTIPLKNKNPSAIDFVMKNQTYHIYHLIYHYIRCASNHSTIYTLYSKPKG